MKILSIKDGIVTMSKPTKVEMANAIYFMWQREYWFEMSPDAHPSWKDYTKNTFSKIREIRDSMTDAEQKEFSEKITNPIAKIFLRLLPKK